MQHCADINGVPHRTRGYDIDIDTLLHLAMETTSSNSLDQKNRFVGPICQQFAAFTGIMSLSVDCGGTIAMNV